MEQISNGTAAEVVAAGFVQGYEDEIVTKFFLLSVLAVV